MSNYVDKIRFHEALKEYKLNGSKKMYERIGKYFIRIAENFLNKPNYINYSKDWKDDMVSEAVYDMVRYGIINYDVERGDKMLDMGKTPNPFAYISQYAYNGVMRYLGEKKEDKEVLVRLSFIENIDKKEPRYE